MDMGVVLDWPSRLLPPHDGHLSAAPAISLPLDAWHVLLLVVLVVVLLPPALNTASWLLWIICSILFGLSRACYTAWIVGHVALDIWLLSMMKTLFTLYRYVRCIFAKASSSTMQRLLHARTIEEYMKWAERIDREEGLDKWREDDSDLPQADMLKLTIAKLDKSLKTHDVQKLQFTLLNGLLKRNHLGIDERNLHLKAFSGTKRLVEDYDRKVVECIQYLCNCEELGREEKLSFFKKARRALGQTALMLSGGGAIAMYHAGVVRALIHTGMYKYIRVISGTSGGSIIAGMLAMHNEKELMEKVLIKEVATDYNFTGQMKRENIRWFPPIWDQIKHFSQKGVLMDNLEFQRTCSFYYEDFTFQEAFERTRKHVCISVSASTLGVKNPGGPRRLLLNHITTPHVLIRSAVAASCSLPGIMRPNYLLCKDERGQVVPFEQDGVQYVDGSLQADLPFRHISTLFSVSHFIVSQVNFHVVPLLHKPGRSPSEDSLYWRVFKFLDMDMYVRSEPHRYRVTALAGLGLLPRVFGQDISGVFRQRYFGHVTITQRFRTSEMIGLKAFQNPDEAEMTHYIINGERSTWQMLLHIQHNTGVERALSDCMARLRRQTYMASLDTGNGNGNGTTARSLPPLAPGSASSSRSATPRRYHREEAVFPPPGGSFTAASLKRADSGRFDDDGDMLEPPHPVPSPLGRREGQRVRQLEAENEALKLQVDRLSEALAHLLSKTDRGLYHHQESVLTEGDLLSVMPSRNTSLQSQSQAPSPRSCSPGPLGLGVLHGASSSMSVLSEGGREGPREGSGAERIGDARGPTDVGRRGSYKSYSSSGSSSSSPSSSPSPSPSPS